MKRAKSICYWLSTIGIGLTHTGLLTPLLAENLKTDSRMPYRHVIPLRDINDEIIAPAPALDAEGKPQEAKGNAFSTSKTCGRCHEYHMISSGWHFNAGKGNVKAGRPGEPWILTDTATRTQIPLSYRGWNGTFKPAEVGLSDYDFLATFARHFPGGGVGEPARDQINTNDVRMRRLLLSGPMEIDCLICHTKHGEYDHELRYKGLNNENFKWSATIASELGVLSGRTGKSLADSWRPPRPAPTNAAVIKYHREKFDAENHVTFEVTRHPSVNNCYYCHTTEAGVGDNRWHSDDDVHIRAGMKCTDCHRNGIDHMIVRGYDGEVNDRTINDETVLLRAKMFLRDDATLKEADAKKLAEAEMKNQLGKVETLSCRGCHYGSTDEKFAGRLGAPFPEHKGMPPIHFEKLTCTACHSGPIPKDATEIVHTSLAHKLGLPAPSRGENTPPVIVQPVFLRDGNGRIAPHKMVWPSYWGLMKEGKVTPILPEEVTKIAEDKFPRQTREEIERDPYNTKPLADETIKEVLTALAVDQTNGVPVFVASGKLYRLEGASVKSEEHATGKPYAWALGHDVRPASQSLGVKGCADCHGEKSPIYFGTVAARGPVDPKNGVSSEQWSLRNDDKTVASTFAFTFKFRPMLKYITFGCAVILLGVLLSHGLSALGTMTRGVRPEDKRDSK